ARQRPRPVPPTHRPQSRLRQGDRAQRPPRLPGRGPRLPPGEVLPSPLRPAFPDRGPRPSPGRRAAPQPTPARQEDQLVDARPRGRGLVRPALDAPRALRRGHPPGLAASGHLLATGQALDHLPRPRLRAKKKARDRLIHLAASHPDWVLGFQDETWWSRLALPALSAWAGAAP